MVILFDQFNMPDDIFKVIFATEQQETVGKLLINYIKENGGEIGKTEMSMFATRLHEGTLIDSTAERSPFKKETPKLSYNKRQFYDRILTPMKSMGLVDYDLYIADIKELDFTATLVLTKESANIQDSIKHGAVLLCFASEITEISDKLNNYSWLPKRAPIGPGSVINSSATYFDIS